MKKSQNISTDALIVEMLDLSLIGLKIREERLNNSRFQFIRRNSKTLTDIAAAALISWVLGGKIMV